MRLTTMAQFFGDKIAGWKPGLWNCNRSGFVEFLIPDWFSRLCKFLAQPMLQGGSEFMRLFQAGKMAGAVK